MLMSRRAFLRQSSCAALGITGLVNTLAHLTLTRAALAQGIPGEDYKALVVLFLYGGNDSNNMLIPRMGHPGYADYKTNRGVLAILDPNDPAYVATRPASIPLGAQGIGYGAHPSLAPLVTLFNSGQLAFVANVGTLAFPMTRSEYLSGSVPVPLQLFSHSDQQIEWQSSVADKPFLNGWGGRVADLLKQQGYAGDKVSLSIALSGINSLQVGSDVVQYSVSSSGAVTLAGYGTNYSSAYNSDGVTYRTSATGQRLKAFDEITAYTHQNLHEEAYNSVMRRARSGEGIVGAAFAKAAQSAVNLDTIFAGATTSLGTQLKTIARLIAGRSSLSNRRQIFFCSVGGFDTHSDQISSHANLMTELSNSLKAFSDATTALGVNDQVLTLTHSDFTRTFTPNGTDISTAGSDHGWGGHHLVMGGPVRGGKIYGTFPSLKVGMDQDAASNRGRWIPTSSVDQYAAVGARWLGVENSALSAIFPNLHRFDDPFGSRANLDFVTLT